jgi:hypothetical protein
MKYRLLTKKEQDQVVIEILDTLLDPSLPFSGKHRREQWEKGLGENLKNGDHTPRYFGKYKVNRINQKFVVGSTKNFEQKMLYSIIDELTYRYLAGHNDIYEFGCGTGHNLLRVRKINKSARLHGFDWVKSSNELVRKLGFHAEQFDFFEPNLKIKLEPNSAVYTVAALEQVGTRYERFLKYLLKQKPSVVVNIEPMPEFLDPTNLLDYLSIKYMKKRRYLDGYYDALVRLEKEGKIEILEARRSGIGSKFIDGYSIVVWRPLI